MNTTAPTALTSSRRVLVAGGAGFIGAHRVKHLLRRCGDIVIFGNLSARYQSPMRKGEYMLPGNLAGRAKPVTRLLREPAYDKHHAANGTVAYT